jgi:3-dehydroquinate synthetase
MVAAAYIAGATGRLKVSDAERITHAVLSMGRLPRVSVSAQRVVARLVSDKKTRAGQVHFILPKKIGAVEVVTGIPESVVLEAVEVLRQMSAKL